MNIENYPTKLTAGYYRVRESWEDAASQLGAYRLLSNAIAKADENPGYHVYSNEGEPIYPEEENSMEEESGLEEDRTVQAEDEPANEETSQNDHTTDEEVPSDDAGTVETSGDSAADMPSDEEFPEAVEYDNDGGEEVVAYAKLKTLMNIRMGNSQDAVLITTYKKDTVVEVLQVCDNGWLRIKCTESDVGYAYVSNEGEQYAFIGKELYTVKQGDNLWTIADEQLGSGTRYTEIRELNGLTCNVIRVGMPLILPEK